MTPVICDLCGYVAQPIQPPSGRGQVHDTYANLHQHQEIHVADMNAAREAVDDTPGPR